MGATRLLRKAKQQQQQQQLKDVKQKLCPWDNTKDEDEEEAKLRTLIERYLLKATNFGSGITRVNWNLMEINQPLIEK